jgi:hypothetical protein
MSTNTLSSTITHGITSTGAVTYAAVPDFYGAVTGVILSTVSNAGHITNGRYGIYLRDGGLVTNTGSIYGGTNGVKGENITSISIQNSSISFDRSTYSSTLVNDGYIGANGYAVQFFYGGSCQQ